MIRVLVVGPDGTGKTTVAQALSRELQSRGFEIRTRHGASRVRRHTAAELPHHQKPRGWHLVAPKLILAFARYAAGWYAVVGAPQIDILERGWEDQLVDPLRYRLPKSSARLVRWLGLLLSRSDLCILLAGDAVLVHGRKQELSVAEIDRQITVWRQVASRRSNSLKEVDCVHDTPGAIATAVAELLVELFAHHDRWFTVRPTPPRVDLRAVASRGAIAATSIYQPSFRRARGAHLVALTAFRTGLRAETTSPIPELRSILASCGLGGLAVATINSSEFGRLIVGVADATHLVAVVKIGRLDEPGLKNEVRFLEMLEPTGMVPQLLASGHHRDLFYVATRAVARTARSDDVSVDEAVDLATILQAGNASKRILHGDFTPWNIVPAKDRLVLIDWEYACVAVRPLHDVAHFVVQSGALVGRWSPEVALSLLTAQGSPGARHLGALGIDAGQAPALVRDYLLAARPATDARVESFRADLKSLLG
jgi:DNA polymerase III delta prime subunit